MTWIVLAATAVGVALTAVAVAFATARRLRTVERRLTHATDLLARRVREISVSPPIVQPTASPTMPVSIPDAAHDQPPKPPPPLANTFGPAYVGTPTRPPSDQALRDVYADWCCTGTPPTSAVGYEVVALRYVGAHSPTELATPRHTFEDVQGLGELVRITPLAATETLVWPHPASVFDGYTHPLVFPSLTAEILNDADARSRVPPARLVLTSGQWATVPPSC